MRSRRFTAYLFAVSILLTTLITGCNGQQVDAEIVPDENQAVVYRLVTEHLSASGPLVAPEICKLPKDTPLLSFLLDAVTAPPSTDGFLSPLPPNTGILRHTLLDGELSLYLTTEYLQLDGIEKTLADYCLARTFSLVPEVDAVSIYVSNICYVRGMTTDDAILSDITLENQKRLTLYFPDASQEFLSPEYQMISVTQFESAEREIVERLFSGPSTTNLTSIFPDGIELRSFVLSDDVCVINLTAGFAQNLPDTLQETRLLIYSIVNSLCTLSRVNKVRFLEEGQPIEHSPLLPLTSDITPNPSLLGPPIPAKGQMALNVYLRHTESGKLAALPQVVQKTHPEQSSSESLCALALETLVSTPAETGLSNLLTPDDLPLDIALAHGTCTVTLPYTFFTSRNDALLIKQAARAIIATLTDLPDVVSVAFRFEDAPAVYGDADLSGVYIKSADWVIS